MKKIILLLFVIPFIFYAQTNTFPDSGNVGIGTTSPIAHIEVLGTETLGGKWDFANSYLTIWNGSHSLIMDPNEIYASQTLNIGSKSGDIVRFRTVNDLGFEDKLVIKSNGNVGIGVTNPSQKLTVDGNIKNNSFYLANGNGDFLMKRGNSDTNWKRALVSWETSLMMNYHGDYSGGVRIMGSKFTIDGNTGIGTTNPGSWKLAVNGNIRAKEIKVETGWSDFVFEPEYNLPSLEEVEEHIKGKGHLKDIPSAREVEENGIFLGEMDAKLLQKIEELTLYVIELKKENQQLRKEVDQLKKQQL